MDDDLILRGHVLEWLACEADKCDDAAKWGGAPKYVANCKAASYALRNAKSVIEKLPAAPVTLSQALTCPEVRAMVEALRWYADEETNPLSDDQNERARAALAPVEALNEKAPGEPRA